MRHYYGFDLTHSEPTTSGTRSATEPKPTTAVPQAPAPPPLPSPAPVRQTMTEQPRAMFDDELLRPVDMAAVPQPLGDQTDGRTDGLGRVMAWLMARPWVAPAAAFVAGAAFGLVVLGWGLMPVQWTDAHYGALAPQYKAGIVQMASDLNAYEQGSAEAVNLLYGWDSAEIACQMAWHAVDPAEALRLTAVAYAVSGEGCGDGGQ